ncbi:MAG: hypothetical protein IJ862_02810 [Selenomonadaceae bacterium]|nr:hypothetical protein [Selenomonadaceae bacterium]
MKFTKIIFAAVLIVCTMMVASVGQCAKSSAPKYGADKAILAYAEAYAFGSPNDSRYIGLSKNDIVEIKRQLTAKIAGDFEEFCLSEDSVNKLTDVYVKKIKSEMHIKTTIKEKSKESPVVNLTATILDSESLDKQAKSDKKLQALLSSISKLKNEGKTEAYFLKDSDLQKKSVDSLTDFINGLSINQEKTLSVKCKKITGEDEKLYWAPENPEEVMNFVLGK